MKFSSLKNYPAKFYVLDSTKTHFLESKICLFANERRWKYIFFLEKTSSKILVPWHFYIE